MRSEIQKQTIKNLATEEPQGLLEAVWNALMVDAAKEYQAIQDEMAISLELPLPAAHHISRWADGKTMGEKITLVKALDTNTPI